MAALEERNTILKLHQGHKSERKIARIVSKAHSKINSYHKTLLCN